MLSIKGINQSDYDVSLQQVKSYKADMAYTQSLIDKTVIKAPFSGQLGLRQISLGAFINTATTVVTLQKTDDLKIDFLMYHLKFLDTHTIHNFEGLFHDFSIYEILVNYLLPLSNKIDE